MSATDYKLLTATLDAFFFFLHPAHILPVKWVSVSRFATALAPRLNLHAGTVVFSRGVSGIFFVRYFGSLRATAGGVPLTV